MAQAKSNPAKDNRTRILLVDDHAVVRRGLKQILSEERDVSVVGEAKNGHEALEMSRRLEWDVAVVDYAMPGRGGVELLKEIKRHHPKRPVLVLSMYPEEWHAVQVLRAGGAGYLSKETATEELMTAIRKVVKGGRYVSPALAEKLASGLAPDRARAPHEGLSDREYRVLWLLASGKPISQIAQEMFLSPSTISTYRTRILRKLGLANNAQLVQYAVQHQLIG